MDAVAETKQAPLTHQETRLIVIGMLLPVFMASIDQTILASALPTIGRALGNAADLSWLITSYLLTATAAVPLYGKLADIHGRAVMLRIGIVIFLIGSIACAFAPSLPVLIVARGLQGIGGGALTSMGIVVLGDVATPRQRGRYYGYFAVTYTTSGACGPAVGGFLADHVHWSAIFWINVPLSIIALLITARLLRRLPRYERPHRLDVIGAVLIVVASVSLMLALNLAGIGHVWTSAPVLWLLGCAAMVGTLFVLRLTTAPEPLIPLAVLRDGVVRCAVVANAFGWGAIGGLNIFFPTYLQTVGGLSPTESGLSLMIIMVTLNTTAGLAGQLVARVPHYKRLPIASLTVTIAAVLTLAWRAEHVERWQFETLLFLIGLGFGPLPSLTQVALQNAVPRHQLGISVGTMNFCRSLLSTILVAAFGALVLAGGAAVTEATPALDVAVTADAFRRVFLADAACLAIALVAIVVMAERPLADDPESR